jgi:hypothetical protein
MAASAPVAAGDARARRQVAQCPAARRRRSGAPDAAHRCAVERGADLRRAEPNPCRPSDPPRRPRRTGGGLRARDGRPGVDDHDVGPLLAETQHGRVSQHVAAARSDDRARLVSGGGRPEALDDGWFFEPTIFDVSDASSPIAADEVFGPGPDDHPVRQRTRGRPHRQRRWLRPRRRSVDQGTSSGPPRPNQLRAGQVHINSWGIGSGVELSFGGIRRSGCGREKGLARGRRLLRAQDDDRPSEFGGLTNGGGRRAATVAFALLTTVSTAVEFTFTRDDQHLSSRSELAAALAAAETRPRLVGALAGRPQREPVRTRWRRLPQYDSRSREGPVRGSLSGPSARPAGQHGQPIAGR